MTETSVAAEQSLTDHDTRRRVMAIVGASSGNLVEWFDFYVYSFCSLYFAHIFSQPAIPQPSCYKRQGFLPLAF